MVDDRPFTIIPLEVIGTGGEIGAIKKHPDETVIFELLGQLSGRLEELVSIVDPGGFDETTY